jgi:LDH2 family malate/lactate/ureidoglycolate dehydrogenase
MGVKVDIKKYEDFCRKACLKAGLSEEAARETARILVRTDMLGIVTHGTMGLYSYLERVVEGKIKANAKPEIVSEGPTWAVVDGHNGIGVYNGSFALRKGIELAKKSGMAYVGVRNSSHYGATGIYAVEAAEAGMIAIVMSNTVKNMAVPGGKGPIVGNSPMAFSTPAGSHRPVFIDIATSNVAGMRVANKRSEGQSCPEGWIVDRDGKPTTDPTVPDWVLVPMGAHKGYCLSFFIEVFTAILSGGAIFGPGNLLNVSHSLILIDAGKIMDIGLYGQRMESAVREVAESPKVSPDGRIYLPGEMEWEHYEKVEKEGLVLTDLIVNSVQEVAKMSGQKLEDCFPV